MSVVSIIKNQKSKRNSSRFSERQKPVYYSLPIHRDGQPFSKIKRRFHQITKNGRLSKNQKFLMCDHKKVREQRKKLFLGLIGAKNVIKKNQKKKYRGN